MIIWAWRCMHSPGVLGSEGRRIRSSSPAWVLHESCLKRPKDNKERDSIRIHGLFCCYCVRVMDGIDWFPSYGAHWYFYFNLILHFTHGLVCFFWVRAEFCILVCEDRTGIYFLAGLSLVLVTKNILASFPLSCVSGGFVKVWHYLLNSNETMWTWMSLWEDFGIVISRFLIKGCSYLDTKSC